MISSLNAKVASQLQYTINTTGLGKCGILVEARHLVLFLFSHKWPIYMCCIASWRIHAGPNIAHLEYTSLYAKACKGWWSLYIAVRSIFLCGHFFYVYIYIYLGERVVHTVCCMLVISVVFYSRRAFSLCFRTEVLFCLVFPMCLSCKPVYIYLWQLLMSHQLTLP